MEIPNIQNGQPFASNTGVGASTDGEGGGSASQADTEVAKGVSIEYLERRYPEYRDAIRAIADEAGLF